MTTILNGITIRFDGRFNGPDGTANGGYACGTVAELIEGPTEVRLSRPPPLNRRLNARRDSDGNVDVREGNTLVAEARPSVEPLQPPPPVSLDTASRVALDAADLDAHPFPNCFVCGPTRDDGLRIFPGEVGDGLFAGPWTPDPELTDASARTTSPFLWAALDCPSGWAIAPMVDENTVAVLGRMTAVVHRRPRAGAPLVIVAEAQGRDGRKVHSRSALYDHQGHLVATASATWITIS